MSHDVRPLYAEVSHQGMAVSYLILDGRRRAWYPLAPGKAATMVVNHLVFGSEGSLAQQGRVLVRQKAPV
jgi:hypothetical protein